MKRIDAHTSNVPAIVGACVVLRNMCEIYGDHCPQKWTVSDTSTSSPVNPSPTSSLNSSNVVCIRNAIRDHIYNQYFLHLHVIVPIAIH